MIAMTPTKVRLLRLVCVADRFAMTEVVLWRADFELHSQPVADVILIRTESGDLVAMFPTDPCMEELSLADREAIEAEFVRIVMCVEGAA